MTQHRKLKQYVPTLIILCTRILHVLYHFDNLNNGVDKGNSIILVSIVILSKSIKKIKKYG